jgi:integrase
VGYAEKVPSPKGAYWRGRYKIAEKKYGTVRNDAGDALRFTTKREAQKAANDAESAVRGGRHRDPADSQMTFGQWANRWYAGLQLAPSTMANIRECIEVHLLRAEFAGKLLAAITSADVDAWEKKENAAGYKPSSVKTWRGTLHTCLEDAMPVLITVNPATRKRGRGLRAGKSRNRGPERVITYPLEGLLLAERMAILSGRDDEFVMCALMQWTGLRLGEAVGLEREYVRPGSLRVEWQLHEVRGTAIRQPPKDDSYRDMELPPFLADLLAGQMRQTAGPCPCHGQAYVFRGLGRPRGAKVPGATLRDVATIAGVSPATVSYVVSGDGRVSARTRERVEEIIVKTRFIPQRAPESIAWHWRRSSFEEMFTAAASGWFPARPPLPQRPVPLAGAWPGVRVRGRNAQGRAEFCWLPVAPGLTPHGLRHSHKSWMHQERVHEVLAEHRLGHELPGIAGRYTHVTDAMRRELTAAMERAWGEALDGRLAMAERSPVAALDGLLQARARDRQRDLISRGSPERSDLALRRRR